MADPRPAYRKMRRAGSGAVFGVGHRPGSARRELSRRGEPGAAAVDVNGDVATGARNLIRLDLIAYERPLYQVLSFDPPATERMPGVRSVHDGLAQLNVTLGVPHRVDSVNVRSPFNYRYMPPPRRSKVIYGKYQGQTSI
jgi:hypothetical protein